MDTEDKKTAPVGRGAINDYQWLDNDHCAAIAAGKAVILYDRARNTLDDIAALPGHCNRIGEPSPDGRFAFCAGLGAGVLVDFKMKTAVPVTAGAGTLWVANDTFAFSREVPDSDLRGMWLLTVGEGERRISPEPYLVSKTGAALLKLASVGSVAFLTTHGLSTMKPDGTALARIVPLANPPSQVLEIELWK